jgi:pimeloyl-ACP methyl ester carboxylesterase
VAAVRAEAFSIDVGEAVLEDLRTRLARTRWPPAAPGEPWAQGTDRDVLQELLAYWADGFDWRAQERALNAYPQFVAEVGGVRVHFVHVRGGGTPLILSHGWPSAFVEYLPLVERLSGFDLVIPSLPGYAYSERPDCITTRDTARLWHELMRGLGYERYGAGGTDWGAGVTAYMALDDPAPLIGIHLSTLDVAPSARPETPAEQAFAAATAHWDATERGYSFIQGTRPQTLAYGLTDSPAGLAAWILEKWRAWGDTSGDLDRYDRDFLLTLLTLYWATGTIATSIRDYRENREAGTAVLDPGAYVTVPTAIAHFPHSFVSEGRLPREWAERAYNVTRFTDMPRGGHFAAVEEPELLAADIAAFFS